MSAETMKVHVAYCEDCDWESETFDSSWDADEAAEKHNDQHHPFDPEDEPSATLTPYEAYQAILDAAMVSIT